MYRTSFDILGMWPVYSKSEIIHDKCVISEITSNTFSECGRMFFPQFLELAKYATQRFNAINLRHNKPSVELADV